MEDVKKKLKPELVVNRERYITLKSLIKETNDKSYHIKELPKCIFIKNKIKS